MNNIGNRLTRLEKQTGDNKAESVWLVVVYDGQNPTEAGKEAAIEAYKAKHPDWQERDFNVISVIDAETKELTERVIAGERTE